MDERAELVAIEELWTAQNVADYIKASRSWVYKAAEAGTLPCLRIGAMLRFDPAAVRAFVAGTAAGPALPLARTGSR